MDKIFTIKSRILHFIEKKDIKKGDFFEEIGISASNFKGDGLKSEIGGDKIVKILTFFPDLSSDWLLLGKEPMLRSQVKEEKPIATLTQEPGEGIPLIPYSAMAGVFSGEISVISLECEHYVIPMFKGAEFLIPVKGSSMYPKYSSGDVVACKKVPLNDIFFQPNKVYVLDTVQGALIKRVKNGSDKDHILIVSENPQYEPFELKKDQLNAVAIVIGVIRLE